jgi:sulfite reductase (NADPH) flavoprotein alpha-component
MDMTLPTLPEAGISETDRELIRQLARSLTPDQALWVGGYLAGAARARVDHVGVGTSGNAAAVPAATPAQATTVRILYASETGNAAGLARDLEGRAKAWGLAAQAEDVARYRHRGLADEEVVLFVSSTHGDGDPPQSATGFFDFLNGRKAPSLRRLRYAVLALGDSTYEFFCEAGKHLDLRLAELGGRRLLDRRDCDVDYGAEAAAWMDEALARVQEVFAEAASGDARRPLSGRGGQVAALPVVPAGLREELVPVPAAPIYDKTRPFPAEVTASIRITGRGSERDTRHLELDLTDSGLDYRPGDALGIIPRNHPAEVETLTALFGWNGAEALASVPGTAGPTTLAEALGSACEIAALTPRFIQAWADLSGDASLSALGADRKRLAEFMAGHHVTDLVRAHPVPGLAPQTFVALLRPLQPRLYSIASSAAFAPDEVHICLAPLRYQLHATDRRGVASAYLADLVGPGELVPVYVQRNDNFRLPQVDDAPIVMIGAGTGVAPYRGFMQDREARGVQGRSWLVFGERHFRSDFLYQAEWQDWLRSGVLDRIDLAFSRDQAGRIYVQDRLREHGAELYRWIEAGAHLYVCGDATRMARDVHAALVSVIAAGRARGEEDAREYLAELQTAGRYQRDVY